LVTPNFNQRIQHNGLVLVPGLDDTFDWSRFGSSVEPHPHVVDSVQRYPLGTALRDNALDRVWRYAKAGGVEILQGRMVQMPVPAANHNNEDADEAAAAGSFFVNVDIGATAVTLNQYAGGVLHVNEGAGEGFAYRIKSNPAADASAEVLIELYDPLLVALTTASKITLTMNPYKDLVIAVTTLTAAVMGATARVVPINNFFWCQTRGPAAVLVTGTVVIGEPVVTAPATTNGSVAPWVIANTDAVTRPLVGHVLNVNATTEYALIFLTLE
jgi:hypothetical protein